ncbi:YjcZ family sporulation protein [Brevibacillus humidisoli]|nr:YjcZ family sporulation protein [Brevibacillus humidisoli]UFJ43033.1 YjcZ family sporulation protein [Brevibacillus humidisoli]
MSTSYCSGGIFNNCFALVLVLFILLVIVGESKDC